MSQDERKTDKDNFSILLQLSPEFALLLNDDGTPRKQNTVYHLKKLKNAYNILTELVKTPTDRIWREMASDIYAAEDQGSEAYVGRWRLHYHTKAAFTEVVDDVIVIYRILKDIDKNVPKCSLAQWREMSGFKSL